MRGNIELLRKYLSVTASLIEHIDEVGVFKDILNLTACKQVLYILSKSRRDTAPFSETLPDFAGIRRCLLLFKKKVKLVDKLTAKELYLMHADGRDEGLRDIDSNSPTAFSEWYECSRKGIGHPWEVCRGGNSTHISLYVRKNGNEYSLKLAGSSYGRSVETIKFFLALVRNNIPVSLYEGEELAARVRADDKIGIVPDGVMPFYCSSYFPDDENISDYMNIELYEDKERWKKVIENVIWQEIEEQRLL